MPESLEFDIAEAIPDLIIETAHEIAAAEDVLEAECAASALWGVFELSAGRSADPVTESLLDMAATAITGFAERGATPEALALLRALGRVGPARHRRIPAAGADRLGVAGLPEPAWARGAGDWEVRRCWTLTEVGGGHEVVSVTFGDDRVEHAVSAVVVRGGGVVDALVSDDPDAVWIGAQAKAGPDVVLATVTPGRAHSILAAALARPAEPEGLDQLRSVALYRALLIARLDLLEGCTREVAVSGRVPGQASSAQVVTAPLVGVSGLHDAR